MEKLLPNDQEIDARAHHQCGDEHAERSCYAAGARWMRKQISERSVQHAKAMAAMYHCDPQGRFWKRITVVSNGAAGNYETLRLWPKASIVEDHGEEVLQFIPVQPLVP